VGFVVDRVALVKVAPRSPSSIIWGWYNRPVVAAVPSGLSLTPLIIIIIIKKKATLNIYACKCFTVMYLLAILTSVKSDSGGLQRDCQVR
jgi:hypothetical protein